MTAGEALDAHEVAGAKVFEADFKEGSHIGLGCLNILIIRAPTMVFYRGNRRLCGREFFLSMMGNPRRLPPFSRA
jgi:hypothetical protein